MQPSSSPALARVLVVASFVLFAVGAIETWLVAPELPDPMATHFAGSGRADGWMSKRAALAFAGTFGAALVLGLALLPSAIRRTPTRWVNLPNRDHWLTPERREATLAFITVWVAGLSAAMTALLVWTHHLVLEANLRAGPGPDDGPRLADGFLWCLGAFMIGLVVGLALLFTRFSKRRMESERQETGSR